MGVGQEKKQIEMSVEILRRKIDEIESISEAYRRVRLGRGVGPGLDRNLGYLTNLLVAGFVVGVINVVILADVIFDLVLMLAALLVVGSLIGICLRNIIMKTYGGLPTWPEVLTIRLEAYEPVLNGFAEKVQTKTDRDGNVPINELGEWLRAERDEVYRLYDLAELPKIKLPLRSEAHQA